MRKVREKEREIIFASVLLLDQFFKFLALRFGLASINQAILFGTLFYGSTRLDSARQVVSLLLIFAILIFLAVCFFKWGYNLGLLLIVSGGVSNLIDRLVYGGVVDYLSLPLIPTFNLADLAIVVGCGIFLFDLLGKKKV